MVKPTMPPVEIIISKGDQNIAIKISDRGGGASLEQQQKWEAYLFSSGDAAPAENLNNPISVPMAGYGYGIPLTKVMARYLGGDIETRSIEDYGTDVYIYLQNCPETCFEGILFLKSVTNIQNLSPKSLTKIVKVIKFWTKSIKSLNLRLVF